MPHLRNLPAQSSVFDIFLSLPDLYRPFADFCQRLFRGPGALPVRDRELIFSYVSNLNACQYCFGGHSRTAILFGVDPGAFDKLSADIDSAPVEAKLKPLLRYAKKLTETPARMTPADAKAVYDAGWSDEAMHQAIAICALANFMNRLVEGTGVKADPAKFDLRAKSAAEKGYNQPFLDSLAKLEKASAS
jgi:uncharacterized peroxidase-related enzyme